MTPQEHDKLRVPCNECGKEHEFESLEAMGEIEYRRCGCGNDFMQDVVDGMMAAVRAMKEDPKIKAAFLSGDTNVAQMVEAHAWRKEKPKRRRTGA